MHISQEEREHENISTSHIPSKEVTEYGHLYIFTEKIHNMK
jgi:hypothetical protein